MEQETKPQIDIPIEAVGACLGETYYWFEGEAVASASVASE